MENFGKNFNKEKEEIDEMDKIIRKLEDEKQKRKKHGPTYRAEREDQRRARKQKKRS